METKRKNIKEVIIVGMFAAIFCVGAQLSIPLPSGVPFTLNIIVLAIAGYIIGPKLGFLAALVYVLLGAVGLPVYTNGSAGFGVILGATGGFLIAYPFYLMLCGLGGRSRNKFVAIFLGLAGICVVYVCGVIQFAFVTHSSLLHSFLVAGAPYLLKDIVCVIAAYFIGVQVKVRLAKTNLLQEVLM